MKRICSLFLSLCLVLGLCACGQKAEEAPAASTWQEQYDLGIRYLSEGNYEEAIIAFTAAIEIDPKRPEAYIGLADTHAAQGNRDRATEILKQALETVADKSVLEEKLQQLSMRQPLEGYPKTERVDMDTGYYHENEYDQFGMRTRWVVYAPDGSVQRESFWEYADDSGKLLRKSHNEYGRDFHIISVGTYDENQRLIVEQRDWVQQDVFDGNGENLSHRTTYSYMYQSETEVKAQVTRTYRDGRLPAQGTTIHVLGADSTYMEITGLRLTPRPDNQPDDLWVVKIQEYADPWHSTRTLEFEEGLLLE